MKLVGGTVGGAKRGSSPRTFICGGKEKPGVGEMGVKTVEGLDGMVVYDLSGETGGLTVIEVIFGVTTGGDANDTDSSKAAIRSRLSSRRRIRFGRASKSKLSTC